MRSVVGREDAYLSRLFFSFIYLNKCAAAIIIIFNWNSHCAMTHLRRRWSPYGWQTTATIEIFILAHLHHNSQQCDALTSMLSVHAWKWCGVTSLKINTSIAWFLLPLFHDMVILRIKPSAFILLWVIKTRINSGYFRFHFWPHSLSARCICNNVSFLNWNT